MAEIEGLVRALREGDDAAKAAAARRLGWLAFNNRTNKAAIAEAGGIPPLVELLCDRSAEAKRWAARALGNLSRNNDANAVLIAAAGGIPPLVDLLRDESANAELVAASALWNLPSNNASNNAVAVAAAVGLEALIELARRGRVTFKGPGRRLRLLSNAGGPAKRKAALVVAALLGGCVPDSVPRVLKAAIGSYL